MTREEKKEELIGLFSTGAIYLGDLIDDVMNFAEENIEKEATRKIVECSEFLAKLPHWISVEDEMPKEDGRYLFYHAILGVQSAYYYNDLTLDKAVTHWMPMPAPPKHIADVSKMISSSELPNNCKTKGVEQ